MHSDHVVMVRQYCPLFRQASSCWNWKCALLSATARSLVYVGAMTRTGLHGSLTVGHRSAATNLDDPKHTQIH